MGPRKPPNKHPFYAPEDSSSLKHVTNAEDIKDFAPRRSGRATKKPSYPGDTEQEQAPAKTRKRKANNPALDEPEPEAEQDEGQQSGPDSDPDSEPEPELPEHVTKDIIAASLEPWKENELEEWDGWAEVVSDPKLFTDILRKLGVEDAEIREPLDLETLAATFEYDSQLLRMVHLANSPSNRSPVYGLVFLQSYRSMRQVWLPRQPDDKSDLWFSRQTATNACGTIALLNIVMNAKDLALGEKLSEFKEQSKDLSPSFRGNKVATSTFIRAAHNMHNSRLDLLNAVLELEQDAMRNKRARAAKRARGKAASANRRRSSGASSAAYHFVAFVPIGNGIWLFDGLDTEPGYICDIENPDNWLIDIQSTLEEYMRGRETECNLMALCGNTQTDSDNRAASRQNDFGLAIHEWIKRLSESGALDELVEN
uniref:ubiquitinyl hydrolase 1 n=1 Tax=Podospora anserina TaxID=2587412 RepID=Q874W7_PODAS|nr:unnamed protein product [Podospora anserina]